VRAYASKREQAVTTSNPDGTSKVEYHPRGIVVVKQNESAGTMAHELGHHVEYWMPGAQKAAQEFLAHRVGNQPLQSSRHAFPGSRYKPDEMGRDDDFAKAFGKTSAWYVGKHYSYGSTEVISDGRREITR
jgi:hypothetical protein